MPDASERVGFGVHPGSETVIQDGREVLTVENRVPGNGPSASFSQSSPAGVVDARGTAVTTISEGEVPVLLEKALTSSLSVKSEPELEPHDLSRFCQNERVGFSNRISNEPQKVIYSSLAVSSSSINENCVRIETADYVPTSTLSTRHPRKMQTGLTSERVETAEIKTEDRNAPSVVETPGGTVILASERRVRGGVGQIRVVTRAGDGDDGSAVQTTWSERDGTPVYHWSQLVPLITTTPHSPLVTKGECSEDKPMTNGNVITNGQDPENKDAATDVIQDRRESVGNETDFDPNTDDDDVFVSEYEGSLSAGNKRRTQSLGALPGKDDPKSPRKVRLIH